MVKPYGTLRGSGAYTYNNPGPWGRYGRAIGGMVGGKYGGPLGAAMGSKLGSYAHYLGKIFGSGDYVTSPDQVKFNVLVNESQIPQFVSSKEAIRIRHREFLGDVISSSVAGAFQIQQFPINPGQSVTFEWLSQVCGSTFQQYRVNGMVFEFRTMSADALNSVNTALGSVVMATDYDSADSPFTTKSQMENTEFGVSCKPSSCMIHAIECAKNQTSVSELYIRAGAVPSGKDIRFYDLGQFYIATVGCQGTSVNLGELWVSYDITVFKAIQQPAGFLIPTAHYQLDQTVMPAQLLKPKAGGTAFDTIGLVFNTSTYLSVSFPLSIPLNSCWSIQLYVQGASTAAAAQIGFADSNGWTRLNITNNNSGSGLNAPSPSGNTSNMQSLTRYYQYTGGGTPAALPTFTLTAPGTPLSSYISGDLIVSMINGTIV